MCKYKFVFVVLVYKNTDVLIDFYNSLNVPNSKVIIVNSYYDDESLLKCKVIAQNNNSDFIAIPNKGYGYGNNVGCQYAIDNYEFDYLILSNSDIKIQSLDALEKYDDKLAVFAPHVLLPTGKRQNPNIAFFSSWYYKSLRKGYMSNKKMWVTCGHVISRLQRELILLWTKVFSIKRMKIFSPHGCFIIFTYSAVKKLNPLFLEEMFLYYEEIFLGFKCDSLNVPIYYIPKLSVLHLEGASSFRQSDVLFKNGKQAFEALNKWCLNNKINKVCK